MLPLRFRSRRTGIFPFISGQFISAVAADPNGKQQTRAYSIASAANANHFELCVNRVPEGFFSNHLADLTELPPGGTIQVHGPHGHFVLKQPVTDSIFISTGTGIAPMRGFAQWLFPETGPDAGIDRSEGKEIWMVYGTRHESELYYREEFEALAARKPNFHYLPTLSRADESWKGLRGYVQDHVARIVEERAARLGLTLPVPPPDPAIFRRTSSSTSTPTSAASTTWSPASAKNWPATAGTASKSSSSATTKLRTATGNTSRAD